MSVVQTVDDVRRELAMKLRGLVEPHKEYRGLVVVFDRENCSYSTDGFDPTNTPTILRELAEMIERGQARRFIEKVG
jgi:hypothetical protein